MNLTETPESVIWPESHYVFVEKVGSFMTNAPASWQEAHALTAELMKHNTISGYMSLYKVGPLIYRAGFVIDRPPLNLPRGLTYEVFPGGAYAKFVLTGPYSQLPEASGRVAQIVAEKGIMLRDDFYIENYANDPRSTPEEQLITEILVPSDALSDGISCGSFETAALASS